MIIAISRARMKWWHWTMLVTGSVMIIGVIIGMIVI